MRAKLVFAAVIAAVTVSLLVVPGMTQAISVDDAYAVASAS